MENSAAMHESTRAAVEAYRRGYRPVPVRTGSKAPAGSGWTHLTFKSEEQVRTSFEKWNQEGVGNIGLILGGEGGLINVDLDHPKARRLASYLLPPTAMMTGRPGSPKSHYWYVLNEMPEDPSPEDEFRRIVPDTRKYALSNGSVIVELRSTGGQTVIPPSDWKCKDTDRVEKRNWSGQPWGGQQGPTKIDGRVLAVQVATLALVATLLDAWPGQGQRHEAYLALAGGLLRRGEGVSPFWRKQIQVVIGALADATGDEDGAETRVREVLGTTLKRLNEGGTATGFGRLSEIIGIDAAETARRIARNDIEALAGVRDSERLTNPSEGTKAEPYEDEDEDDIQSTLGPEIRNPLSEEARSSGWARVDLDPYITGELFLEPPGILYREDGVDKETGEIKRQGLFYPGLVNTIFGLSESGKSWLAMKACAEEMGRNSNVVYLDFEDTPYGAINRLRKLGVLDDDIRNSFVYIYPTGPLASMERSRFGEAVKSQGGLSALADFTALLESKKPTLIIADGMTSLYGLHGLNPNDGADTDVITKWMMSLCRDGQTTVIVVDHTTMGGGGGPGGAHHKTAMVQGSSIKVETNDKLRPGTINEMQLILWKDRNGMIRQNTPGRGSETVAAIIEMHSDENGNIRDPKGGDGFKIKLPNEPYVSVELGHSGVDEEAQLGYAAHILAIYKNAPETRLTVRDVGEHLGLDTSGNFGAKHEGKSIRDAFEALIVEQCVEIENPGRGRTHRFILTPYGSLRLGTGGEHGEKGDDGSLDLDGMGI